MPDPQPIFHPLTTLSKNQPSMSTHAWERHNELIYCCGVSARWLKTKIEEAKARLTIEDEADHNGVNHAAILKKWKTLQAWQHMVQRTESLCDWERTVHMDDRTDSSFDAVPASRSRYVWALNIRGESPVSPMRAVFQLEKSLTRALQLMMNF
jgi:hypothetical protein